MKIYTVKAGPSNPYLFLLYIGPEKEHFAEVHLCKKLYAKVKYISGPGSGKNIKVYLGDHEPTEEWVLKAENLAARVVNAPYFGGEENKKKVDSRC